MEKKERRSRTPSAFLGKRSTVGVKIGGWAKMAKRRRGALGNGRQAGEKIRRWSETRERKRRGEETQKKKAATESWKKREKRKNAVGKASRNKKTAKR
ncbi:MAG: hypothetical protein IJ991_14805 [Thermoguttaceae bacterium]|nr:hypothetical protein [Thermoguttaceae bacterium]